MGSTASHESHSPQVDLHRNRLYVAWQDPSTRSMEPVGRLDRSFSGAAPRYEFRYLTRSLELNGFRPFVSFPDLRKAYYSQHLFPFFENRLMSRTRADYPEFVQMLGLKEDADPFEILARSEGRRQTDTMEVFPVPAYDGEVLRSHFLVHGISHVPFAQDVLESLTVGERLLAVLDSQNKADYQAVLLRDESVHLLGWVPRYLTVLIRRPLERIGSSAVVIKVEHVGARNGPIHLRLLCEVRAEWRQAWERPFSGPEFQAIVTG